MWKRGKLALSAPSFFLFSLYFLGGGAAGQGSCGVGQTSNSCRGPSGESLMLARSCLCVLRSPIPLTMRFVMFLQAKAATEVSQKSKMSANGVWRETGLSVRNLEDWLAQICVCRGRGSVRWCPSEGPRFSCLLKTPSSVFGPFYPIQAAFSICCFSVFAHLIPGSSCLWPNRWRGTFRPASVVPHQPRKLVSSPPTPLCVHL